MAYKPLHNELLVDGEEEIQPLTNGGNVQAEDDPDKETESADKHEDDDDDQDIIIEHKPSKWFKIIRYVMGIGAFVLLFALLISAIILVALAPGCKKDGDGLPWWKTTVIYQCYPRSFKDSSGDGNGDLKGIQEKLYYLNDLGVNSVWLNPIFKSPQRDNGYDISNYTDVDKLYGTIEDLCSLLNRVHNYSMHLILDFVPNHTSDEHPWFVESRSSLTNPKRDWYVWANASSDGGPPNNWLSLFGGSAWSLDNTTGQYYLHQFSAFQPDLNYHNEEVRKAMEDVIKFWFDFGVDGFRIDAVIFLLEDPQLRNEQPDPDFNDSSKCLKNNSDPDCYNGLIHNMTKDYEGIHDIIKQWRKIADSYTDKFFVGETYDPVETVMTYYGSNNDEFHFPFNFLLLSNTNWTGSGVEEKVSEWMDALPKGAWPNWVLGNHDNSRIANKVGNFLARAVNVLLLTLPGTPTTYYGEEIFMTDVDVPDSKKRDLYQDRDKERTPMQWNTQANAGFTNNETPWLPVATNYTLYNVEVENSTNSTSMLKLYKRIVKLITSEPAFRFADYDPILSDEDIFAFHRFHESSKDEFIVIINFSEMDSIADLSSVENVFERATMELSSIDSSGDHAPVNLTEITLAGGEAVIIRGTGKNMNRKTNCR